MMMTPTIAGCSFNLAVRSRDEVIPGSDGQGGRVQTRGGGGQAQRGVPHNNDDDNDWHMHDSIRLSRLLAALGLKTKEKERSERTFTAEALADVTGPAHTAVTNEFL